MASIGGISFNLVSSFKGMSLAGSSGSPFLRGGGSGGPRSCSVALPSKPMRFQLTVQMAHKKGAGSTKNGRDSPGQRLGVKIYGDQRAKAGSIIIRQRGTKFHPGNNVGLGKDYTIYSLIDGVVKFEKFGPDKKKISVYPKEVQPENPNSYRVRKREYFRALRQLKKERQARRAGGYVPEPQLVLASNDTDSVPLC